MARFSNGTPARIVITDLDMVITTILDRSLLQADIQANFLEPWQITFAVRSNDPAVNVIFSDFDPLVAQSNRLAFVFIREDPGDLMAPWICRASGILMSPQDQADADTGTTRFIVYDPWQYIFGRPCQFDDGTLPGPQGSPAEMIFVDQPGSVIAATLLKWCIEGQGVGCFIDAGPDYAGTLSWTGTIEDTPIITFTVQQGMTLGDAWNQLIATADDPASSGPFDGCDIVLDPIYDPSRGTYTSQLSIYNLAGRVQAVAGASWGTLSRTATTADREHDGTPGAFINEADFHVGQGGVSVPLLGPVPSSPASVAKYRPYRQTQFFPDQNQATTVLAMAYQALTLGKQGKRTFTVDIDPIRTTALPFRDYNPGDFIPVLAPSNPANLRVLASGNQRIMSMSVQIKPDGVTVVESLQTTPDWRGAG